MDPSESQRSHSFPVNLSRKNLLGNLNLLTCKQRLIVIMFSTSAWNLFSSPVSSLFSPPLVRIPNSSGSAVCPKSVLHRTLRLTRVCTQIWVQLFSFPGCAYHLLECPLPVKYSLNDLPTVFISQSIPTITLFYKLFVMFVVVMMIYHLSMYHIVSEKSFYS